MYCMCTSNKCLLKAIPFPQFINGAPSVIILVIIHHEAQICLGLVHQAITSGLESTFTHKPVSFFIQTWTQHSMFTKQYSELALRPTPSGSAPQKLSTWAMATLQYRELSTWCSPTLRLQALPSLISEIRPGPTNHAPTSPERVVCFEESTSVERNAHNCLERGPQEKLANHEPEESDLQAFCQLKVTFEWKATANPSTKPTVPSVTAVGHCKHNYI